MSDNGDRINEASPKYIKHPAATSGFWQDGETLDAGTAMIITNNLSHLAMEGCRQLVTSLGGNLDPPQDDLTGYTGITDVGEPVNLATAPDEQQISWTQRTAYRFGPFLIPADKDITIDRKSLRKVRVLLDLYIDSGNLNGYLYLTSTPARPSAGYIAKTTFSSSTGGFSIQELTLDCQQPVLANTIMPGQSGQVAVFQVYLWIGLKWDATGGDCFSISAFEVR